MQGKKPHQGKKRRKMLVIISTVVMILIFLNLNLIQ